MKYLNKELTLKICLLVLFLAGVMDILRGVTHTFKVRYAAVNFAGIDPNSDNLVLMGAFGISNFLTGFLYFLLIWKAKKIVPYVLMLIPISYLLGGLGMRYSNVVLESEFRGQYMMSVYLSICLFTALLYFLVSVFTKKENRNLKLKQNL